MTITVRVEWDMGHRLPLHQGECRNMHGHRYAAEVTLSGAVKNQPGAPDDGMLVDFGDAKRAIRSEVAKLDHRFLVCDHDEMADHIAALPGVVRVPFAPTAENIARAFLGACVMVVSGCTVERVRLYETPTSWADATHCDLSESVGRWR